MNIVKIKNQITNIKNHQKASKENIKKKLNYSNLSLFLDCLKLCSLVSSPSKVLPFSQFQRQSALYVRHLGRFGTASNRAIIVRVLWQAFSWFPLVQLFLRLAPRYLVDGFPCSIGFAFRTKNEKRYNFCSESKNFNRKRGFFWNLLQIQPFTHIFTVLLDMPELGLQPLDIQLQSDFLPTQYHNFLIKLATFLPGRPNPLFKPPDLDIDRTLNGALGKLFVPLNFREINVLRDFFVGEYRVVFLKFRIFW